MLKTPQGLYVNRARNLCSILVQYFYKNLSKLYTQEAYQAFQVWNVNESGANVSRNGMKNVFAPKGCRNVHTITPNGMKWINILISINASRKSIPNYNVFKDVMYRRDYLALCEDGATFGMAKK